MVMTEMKLTEVVRGQFKISKHTVPSHFGSYSAGGDSQASA